LHAPSHNRKFMKNFSRPIKYTHFIKNIFCQKMSFNLIKDNSKIFLYAGDIPYLAQYKNFIGLSLRQHNNNHIKHDITQPHDLPDNSVDIYQAEDVIEHIPYKLLQDVINDIYRILKPCGVFRLSVPDYGCDVLQDRSHKNASGEIVFDPVGGGRLINGKVVDGGHLWFPRYKTVADLLKTTRFTNIKFYHYYDETGKPVTHPIDYSIAYVQRTPDNDERAKNPYRPMSIVVDCIK